MTQDKSQKRNEDKTMIFSTIAAIATPAGRGGIGIVRISGPQSFPIGLYLFKPHRKYHESTLCNRFPYKTHRFYFGHFHDYHQNTPIDEVLIVFMKAPRTYTREDVVEIHGHGGYQTLTSILKAVLDAGAILAEPGEFTKRAYLNGRIDLTQAEAVINLINARSNLSREVAFSQITGNLRKRILDIRKLLIDMMTRMQAEIDFPDEIPVSITRNMLFSEIHNHVVMPIQNLIKNHDQYYFLNKGIQTVIIGAPNVGKSSIINKLIKKSKTKTGAIAGVTRQQQWVRINPKVELLDTPGIIPMKLEDQQAACKLAFVSSISDNAYDKEEVAQELLNVIYNLYKQNILENYKLEDAGTAPTLEDVAKARIWYLNKEKPDTLRAASHVLSDFRKGRLGRMTLDEKIED